MTCPDCAASPSKLCARHAATDNHSDAVDLALERAGVVTLHAIACIARARKLLANRTRFMVEDKLALDRLLGEAERWLRDGKS